MKVLLSGVSSFTGCYIARALVDDGHEVIATLTRSQKEYTDPVLVERIKHSKVSHFVENVSFGSESFQKSIQQLKPQAFINHGLNISGYRSPDFDIQKCVSNATVNLESTFEKLVEAKTLFIHTGTVFERQDDRNYPAYSPYGEAKSLIWEKIQDCAEDLGLAISKVMIADPIGPYENRDRLAPILFKKWKSGEAVEVMNPDFIWDRLPVEWLAQVYVRAIKNGTGRLYRPSAFVASNLDWVKILEKIFQEKSGITTTQIKTKGDAKGSRVNTDTCAELADLAKVTGFFDRYGSWLLF